MRRRLVLYVYRLLAIAFGLAVTELVLRLAGASYPAFDRLTPGLREWGVPHAEGWAFGETKTWVKLNAEGARDVDHLVAKPADVFRIVVVGDSYAAAFHVAREEAFWSVMQRQLHACPALGSRSVEVINISKDGYGTVEESLALRRFGFKYDPDLVVLAFFTGNDFRNNSKALKHSNRPYLERRGDSLVFDYSYEERASFKRWTGWRGDLWYGLVRHSRIVQLFRQIRRQLKLRIELASARKLTAGGEVGLDEGIYLESRDPAWRAAWQTTEDAIQLMRDDAYGHGARFLLMTLSNAIQVNPDREVRRAYAAGIGSTDLFTPDRRLADFAREEAIPILTLAPALREWAEKNGTCVHGFEAPWLCLGHWNVHGHRVAGRLLAERICSAMVPETAR